MSPRVRRARRADTGSVEVQEKIRELADLASRATARTGLILESAGEGIIGLDSNGDQTFVNPAAARLLGYEPLDLIRRPSHSLWHHTRRDGSPYPREDCPIYAAFRDGLVHQSSDEVFWRKDGTSFLVDYVSTPIREHDQLVGAVVVFRDITKEARLESIAEAVETMNNLGYVFSAVRHELGNPVNSVKTALAVLRRNLDRFPPETVRDYLDRSLVELSRVEDLLLSLKSFSLYEHVKSQPLPVNQFLEQFVALARPDLEAKGISLEFRPTPGPGLAHANTRALEQVLLNCLANAVDALDGRERRVISVETVLLADLLEIRVEDSGCGMTPEAQKSLFRPFHTTKPSGTGLGLVIAKKMIARMEGTIAVESEEGCGTRVVLALRREAPVS